VTLLIATGLLREARIISAPGIVAIAGGGDGERLEAKLEEAIGAQPVRALLSSGLAGALDPSLHIGDVVIGRWRCAADCQAARGAANSDCGQDCGSR